MSKFNKRAFDKGYKLSNPIPWGQRVFLCKECKNHFYLPEQASPGKCVFCEKKTEKTVNKEIIIPAGFAIYCPSCRVPLLQAKRNIYRGETAEPADFVELTEHTPFAEPLFCGECKVSLSGKEHMPALIGKPEEIRQNSEAIPNHASSPEGKSTDESSESISEAGEVQNG